MVYLYQRKKSEILYKKIKAIVLKLLCYKSYSQTYLLLTAQVTSPWFLLQGPYLRSLPVDQETAMK